MNDSPVPGRRHFLKGSTGLALAPLLSPLLGRTAHAADKSQAPTDTSRYEFCTFTKPLQHLPYAEMAKTLAAMGFDGIEGAVRPKGHVLPERVEEDLPKLTDALKAHSLRFTVMTTAINEVSAEQATETILRTAAANGVKRYRMGYYRYDLKKPIRAQLDEFRAQLKDLVAFSSELGIKPIYQNHSGTNYFGAPVWDLAEVFEDYSPDEIGVAFDIGHATVEGGRAWPLHFAVIRPYIDTIYVKEPSWHNNTLGWGPVGEGAVDKRFYQLLRESDFTGPVSLHVEYLGHNDPAIVPTVLKAIEKDFASLKALLFPAA
ncbi:MAG: sugar phosphate isomerase/epimerase [Verrucomicrobiaceae bacterium]|nr:sugar phosphate isomerase/epimerase [Verrucomicrobiaceae bacterium]